ncbi:hypothetical protein J6590_020474 [Homalodisca vitripennis]|nr:hypothetical protein J6590_020474 [Homalodisca vitripennis]
MSDSGLRIGRGTPTDHRLDHVRPRSSSQGSQYEPTKVLYGSEPDLRFTGRDFQNYNDSPAKLRISRSRKKYKAPPAPPHTNGMDSSSPDSYQHWEMTGEVVPPVRRLRLFKTKAESSKRKVEEGSSPHHQPLPSPGPLQRSLSSPQFQVVSPAELIEAAERLRPVREPPIGKAADSPVLRSRENFEKPYQNQTNSPKNERNRTKNNYINSYEASREARNNINNSENKSNNVQRMQRSVTPKDEIMARVRNRNNRKITDHRPRGDGVGEVRARGEGSTGKESTPEPVPRRHSNRNHEKKIEKSWGEITPTTKPTAPVKTFYFGMNEDDMLNNSNSSGEDNPEVERFAASIQRRALTTTTPQPPALAHHHASGSDSLSSDPNGEENGPTISLQLRPILPRKQLDIPRFSPTAAWRLLSALESPPPSEEDDLVPLEDRIPAPHHIHPDKSGDSGISGDASPQHQDSTHNSQAAWTPQQDLEETSSDGGLESAPLSPESLPLAKFSPRFSLSLPRDDRLAIYSQSDKMKEEPDSFQSLKKLKRSMSGALGRGVGGGVKETTSLPLDNNWVLSRSVPNSLNNGNASLQRWSSSSPSSPDQEDELSLVKQPSFSYLATGGHVMYLPEYSMPRSHR